MAQVKLRSTPKGPDHQNRVLIVDDEPSISRLLAKTLQQNGYSCLTCQCGQEALRLIDSQEFDIVLSDLCMPEMTGLELLRCAREKHARLAFVMVTSVDEVKVAVQAMNKGADDYLVKPLDLGAVLISINQVLEKSGRERNWRITGSASRKWLIKGPRRSTARCARSSGPMMKPSKLLPRLWICETTRRPGIRSA